LSIVHVASGAVGHIPANTKNSFFRSSGNLIVPNSMSQVGCGKKKQLASSVSPGEGRICRNWRRSAFVSPRGVASRTNTGQNGVTVLARLLFGCAAPLGGSARQRYSCSLKGPDWIRTNDLLIRDALEPTERRSRRRGAAAGAVAGGLPGGPTRQKTRAWKSPTMIVSDGSVRPATWRVSPVSLRWPLRDRIVCAARP
jgi:hypothetical protein